jgi:hypothetical protein
MLEARFRGAISLLTSVLVCPSLSSRSGTVVLEDDKEMTYDPVNQQSDNSQNKRYSAPSLKGHTAAYGSGTIVAAIWLQRPIRGPISSQLGASLPRLR